MLIRAASHRETAVSSSMIFVCLCLHSSNHCSFTTTSCTTTTYNFSRRVYSSTSTRQLTQGENGRPIRGDGLLLSPCPRHRPPFQPPPPSPAGRATWRRDVTPELVLLLVLIKTRASRPGLSHFTSPLDTTPVIPRPPHCFDALDSALLAQTAEHRLRQPGNVMRRRCPGSCQLPSQRSNQRYGNL